VKRVSERLTRALACLALGASVGPLALCALGVVLDDGLPVLFRQPRIGLDGSSFELLKLRTMRSGRVTRWGARLRESGLDELPQLVNVLRGEMAWVGPRPLTQSELVRMGWTGPAYRARSRVRPGLTGPVQVFGSASPDEAEKLEAAYLAHKSVVLDLTLVSLTATMVVFGKGRVRRFLRSAASRSRFGYAL
jgi:lipopolysaccharide/colanic/teichoic acid biosynthesis glycosyltransferase